MSFAPIGLWIVTVLGTILGLILLVAVIVWAFFAPIDL